jgi:hypothetical protein
MAAILDKIQADKAEEKANSQRGLGALLKALFGGLTGFVTGGGAGGCPYRGWFGPCERINRWCRESSCQRYAECPH